MSEEDSHIVLAEGTVPVEELLEVEGLRPCMRLGDETANGGILSVVHVHQIGSAGLLESHTGIEGKGEVLEELDLSVCRSVECVALGIVLVEDGRLKSIRVR